MKDIKRDFYVLFSVVVEPNKRRNFNNFKPFLNSVNCFKIMENSNYGINKKGELALSDGGSITATFDITDWNIFSAIIDKIQTINGTNYHGATDAQSVFNAIFDVQKSFNSFTKSFSRQMLYGGGVSAAELNKYNNEFLFRFKEYRAEDLTKKHILAVLYDAAGCRVRLYEYTPDNGAKDYIDKFLTAEQFNKKAEKDVNGLRAQCANVEELRAAFWRLWDEKKKELAAERHETDAVYLMTDDQREAWKREIERQSMPTDIEVHEARAKYRHDDAQAKQEVAV